MKKKHLKGNLKLNKRSISNLRPEIKGGEFTDGVCYTGLADDTCIICDTTNDPTNKSNLNPCDEELDPLNSKPFLACISNWC